MNIHVLSPDVAAKIAAGEVVERPANVAKELMENSLDAGATEIRVEIREGGARLLRIADNGHGILPTEAPLAFQRHATSKLQTAEDLAAIGTFGFRGEALYSIAAVSHVTLVTRTADDAAGVQVRVQGGIVEPVQKIGTSQGTIVTVEHLFFNVPARKKFLRKPATEAGQIAAIVQRYALAHPERRFIFINEGRTVFQTPGSGDLYDVLVQLYGLENAKQMSPVGGQPHPGQGGSQGDGEAQPEVDFMAWVGTAKPHDARNSGVQGLGPVRIAGYASLPSWSRATRNAIDLFVNRRYIEDRNLTYAVTRAYHTLLPQGRFPIAVILVELDPQEVDVNVHPQKTQVRFVDERRVADSVQRAVNQALLQRTPAPGMRLPAHGTTVEPKRWTGLDAWTRQTRSPEMPADEAEPGATLFDHTPPDFPPPDFAPPDEGVHGGPVWNDWEAEGADTEEAQTAGEQVHGHEAEAPAQWHLPGSEGPDPGESRSTSSAAQSTAMAEDAATLPAQPNREPERRVEVKASSLPPPCGWWGRWARPILWPKGPKVFFSSISTQPTSGFCTSSSWPGVSARQTARLPHSICWSR